MSFLNTHIEYDPTILFDTVHDSEGRFSEFAILEYVFGCVESRSLLLPLIGRNAITVYFELQQAALELVEPSGERAYLVGGQKEATQPKYRAGIVLIVRSTNIGTDVSEFVKVSDEVDNALPIARRPALARGPRN